MVCVLYILQMTGVVRLFYFYSSLLNIADEAHAHRKRREQVRGRALTCCGACQEDDLVCDS